MKIILVAAVGLIFFASLGAHSQNEEEPLSLSFGEALDRALLVSRRIKEAKMTAKIEDTKNLQTFAAIGPRLTVGGTYSYFDKEVAIPNLKDPAGPPMVMRPQEPMSGNITLSQPLSGLIVALQQAHVDSFKHDISQAVLEKTTIEVVFAAADAYRQVQQAESLYKIAQERLRLMERQYSDAQANFRLGRLSNSDILRLEVRVNQAKAGAAAALARSEVIRSKFLDLLDYPLDRPVIFASLSDSPDARDILVPEQEAAYKTARYAHLDVRMADLGRKLAGASSIMPWATLIPNVGAYVRMEHSFGAASAFSSPTNHSFGLTLDWNIWDGGMRLVSFRTARLETFKAEIKLIDAERGVALEIVQRRSELNAAKEVLGVQRATQKAAEEAYRGISERFRLGTVSTTELLGSEEELNGARVDFAKAITDLDVKNMFLQKAMGEARPKSIL